MRQFRTVATALDGIERMPGNWRRFRSIDVARVAVAAELAQFGRTAEEAAAVVLGLGGDLAWVRLQLWRTPHDRLVVDLQRDGLPLWPHWLGAVVLDVGAIAAGAVARLPVRERRGP